MNESQQGAAGVGVAVEAERDGHPSPAGFGGPLLGNNTDLASLHTESTTCEATALRSKAAQIRGLESREKLTAAEKARLSVLRSSLASARLGVAQCSLPAVVEPCDLGTALEEIDAQAARMLPPLPVWNGPDLRASDPGWRWFAARAHARELLSAYDVGFDRWGKVTVTPGGRCFRSKKWVAARGRWCGARAGLHGGNVELFQRPDRQIGRVSGVCTCGGSMTCAVCAPRISAKRAGKIMEGVKVARERGLCLSMQTYTLTHDAGNVLFDEVAVWKEAFKHAFSGKHAVEPRKGRLGYVNAAEVTYGRNGWHFHRHLLTISEGEPDAGLLEDCWRSAARNVCRYTPAFEGHAFKSKICDGGEDYVSKIGWELSNPQGKSSRTPLSLLLDDMEGDRQAGELYIEAVVALTQHKVGSVRWSPGTARKLGLPDEKSDDELAVEDATDTDVLLGALSEGQWRRIVEARIEYQILVAAQEGEAAVNALLVGHGIHALKKPERWMPAAAQVEQQQVIKEMLRNECI